MRGRENERTRVIDFVLLLLAFFSVVGLAQRFGAFQSGAKEALSVYTIETLWETVDPETADCLSVGANLQTENGSLFGVVEEIRRVPHEAVFHREGREMRFALPEGATEDVYLTISIQGRKDRQTLFRADGTTILSEQNLRLYSSRALLSLRVVSTE